MAPSLKSIRPRHVIIDVGLASMLGAVILLTAYLVVLPFPAEARLPGSPGRM